MKKKKIKKLSKLIAHILEMIAVILSIAVAIKTLLS
mgnify:CR=1 FL=1